MTDLVIQHQLSSDIKRYLNGLNEQDLKKKVRRYFSHDRTSWDFTKRLSELGKVLEIPGTGSYSHFLFSQTVPGETVVYRARIIERPDEINNIKDVVNPPSIVSKAGRLNRKGKSLLYTALSPTTAAHEVGAQPGKLVAMATFQTRTDIPLINLGQGIHGRELPMRLQAKADILTDFVERLISQRDKPSHLPDYAETEFIVDTLFTGPSATGWFYPSYADPTKSGLNFCFQPERSLLNLRLDSVSIDSIVGLNTDGSFQIQNVSTMRPDALGNLSLSSYPMSTILKR